MVGVYSASPAEKDEGRTAEEQRSIHFRFFAGQERIHGVIGEAIGSYQVLRQLGTGAMGEVYLAEHRHLKRKAAVKLLARELVGRPDLLERFFLEARATSAIAHPGIVQIFDCEIDPTGRPYIVMEYLDGETVAALLARRGPLPPPTAARHARGMAEALAAAHDTGIVHRDLKPENAFVLSHPADMVKIVDFGIAKLEGDFRAGQVHQTRSGALMGTPLYMSPEQCRDSANIDYRTDLYSLGCVLHEMLTGRPPFTHTALGDLIVAHMTEPARDVRELNAAIPPPLADLVGELLRKDPATRPAGMRAVADRLTGFMGGLTTVPEPALAPVPAPIPNQSSKTTFGDAASEILDDDLDKIPRRRPLALAVAAAVVIGLGVGGVFARRGHAPPAPVVRKPLPATWSTTPAQPTTASTSPPARVDEKEPHGRHGAKKEAAGRHPHHPLAEATQADTGPAATHAPTEPPPAAQSSAAPSAPFDYAGAWEGPWNDQEHGQHGRLYLQVGPGASATGWFSNAGVGQSYQVVGQAQSPGVFMLTCVCPVGQSFTVQATLHDRDGADLRGRLTLASATGVFGQSHVVLRRAPAK
jgi:serine/threonine protein kinase